MHTYYLLYAYALWNHDSYANMHANTHTHAYTCTRTYTGKQELYVDGTASVPSYRVQRTAHVPHSHTRRLSTQH